MKGLPRQKILFKIRAIYGEMPYIRCMKITINVNEALLTRVMKGFGFETKTHAIYIALREADRKHTIAAKSRGE